MRTKSGMRSSGASSFLEQRLASRSPSLRIGLDHRLPRERASRGARRAALAHGQ